MRRAWRPAPCWWPFAMLMLLVVGCASSPPVASAPPVTAASPPVAPLPAAPPSPPSPPPVASPALKIVMVGAPAINCVFDVSCRIVVDDTTGGLPGPGFFQSRTSEGKPGAPAAGLYSYDYRIHLMSARPETACVASVTLDFGPVERLDYDGDGTPDDVHVVTRGGIGSVWPTAARPSERGIVFTFAKPVCAGESSFFFGLTSKSPPAPGIADVQDSTGTVHRVNAVVPSRPR